jgi:hypothetical protein
LALFRPKATPRPAGPERGAALDLKVLKNRGIEVDVTDQGLVRLRYPVAITPWVGSLARRLRLWDGRPLLRTLELDAMGTTVWGWIDDKRTVAELCEKLAERYTLHPREAEVAMTAFVRQLGRRGIVALG